MRNLGQVLQKQYMITIFLSFKKKKIINGTKIKYTRIETTAGTDANETDKTF